LAVPFGSVLTNGLSAVLALGTLATFAWLHQKGRSTSIAPTMIALGLTLLSMFLFVLTQARQSPVAIWPVGQAMVVAAGVSVVRWDARTAADG
jgi:hypothetical protein